MEQEKDKVAGSSIKMDTIEFNLIQKQSYVNMDEVKQNIICFLDINHPDFSTDISNLY